MSEIEEFEAMVLRVTQGIEEIRTVVSDPELEAFEISHEDLSNCAATLRKVTQLLKTFQH